MLSVSTWRVGFHYSAKNMITLLSGLVEVLCINWIPNEQVIVLYVKNLDKTGVLFSKGKIVGGPIKMSPPPQSLCVSFN